jgi:hypothetical protein
MYKVHTHRHGYLSLIFLFSLSLYIYTYTYTYIYIYINIGYYLQPTAPDPPVGSCYVCNLSQLTLQIDTSVSTLNGFLRLVVKGRLGFNSPTIMQGNYICVFIRVCVYMEVHMSIYMYIY